jgi:hypothetical protein
MDLKKNISDSFTIVRNNKVLFIISYLFDLSFIVGFLTVYYVFMTRIFKVLNGLKEIMDLMNNIPEGMLSQQEALKAISGKAEFINLTSSLFKELGFLFLSIFLVWIIFQGISFACTARSMDKKTNFLLYIWRFTVFSAFFYILSGGSFWLSTFFARLNTEMSISIFSQVIINIIVFALLMIIIYLWFMSLIITRRRGFRDTLIRLIKVRTLFNSIPSLLVSILIIGVNVAIMLYAFKLNIILFYLITLFIFIPFLGFTRVFIFHCVEKKQNF